VKLYKAIGGLAALGACLLFLSYPFRNDEHGVRWVLGGIGWFGFMLCALLVIVLGLVALAQMVHRRVTA